MLKHLQQRRQDEQGFTLIELMVVVLIMGILMAIAIPTFLSTQGSANDSGAKSNATNVLTSEKAYFENNQVFLDASAAGTPSTGSTLDSNMPWGAKDNLPSPGIAKNTVIAEVGVVTSGAIAVGATGTVALIMDLSKSGTCFYIYDNETSSTSPILAYGESNVSTGCITPGAYPSATPTATGNAGANIQTASTGFTATTGWYTSW